MSSLRGPQGLGDISTLAATVQRVEGYYPPGTPNYPNGSVAWQNNNPGNLRFAGQPGASAGVKGYAKFPTYADGYQALLNQINMQATPGYRAPNGTTYPNGQTLSEFINQYAPAADSNNTSAYLSTLVQSTGYPPDTLLSTVISGGVSAPGMVADVTTDPNADPSLADPNADPTVAAISDMTPLVLGIIGLGLLWVFVGR
jgi:hypothetical protein